MALDAGIWSMPLVEAHRFERAAGVDLDAIRELIGSYPTVELAGRIHVLPDRMARMIGFALDDLANGGGVEIV